MIVDQPTVIIRTSAPTLLDTAPQQSQCLVKLGDEFALYVQLSSDEMNPKWEEMGIYKPQDIPGLPQHNRNVME